MRWTRPAGGNDHVQFCMEEIDNIAQPWVNPAMLDKLHQFNDGLIKKLADCILSGCQMCRSAIVWRERIGTHHRPPA